MVRHVLIVEDNPYSDLERAFPTGWRVTRAAEGAAALCWLRNSPPDLILVGESLADQPPLRFVRSVKLDHACSLLPLVQVGAEDPVIELQADPDAWLESDCATAVSDAIAQASAVRHERIRDGSRADARLRLPSDFSHLEELNSLIPGWLSNCGFGQQLCQQLTLALRELVANAIEWGHQKDSSLAVSVHCRLDQEKVTIHVSDSGPGFDQVNLPHAARPGDPLSHMAVRSSLQLREGGFGILMTRGMVDQLCYNEAGNEVQLIKFVPRKQVAAGK